MIKHIRQVVVTIALLTLLLLGSAAPFGQDEPTVAGPTPIPTLPVKP